MHRLQEADVKYVNREPREADLRRIAELEEDVKRRRRKVAGLMVSPICCSPTIQGDFLIGKQNTDGTGPLSSRNEQPRAEFQQNIQQKSTGWTYSAHR